MAAVFGAIPSISLANFGMELMSQTDSTLGVGAEIQFRLNGTVGLLLGFQIEIFLFFWNTPIPLDRHWVYRRNN